MRVFVGVGIVVFSALLAEAADAPTMPPPVFHWVPTAEQHQANKMLMEMKQKGLLLPDRPGKEKVK